MLAGVGSSPVSVTGGKVYLTGPYKGAPFVNGHRVLPTGGHRFSPPLGDRHDDGWTFGQRGGRMTLWLR